MKVSITSQLITYAVLLQCLSRSAQALQVVRMFEECDKWAESGECLNNQNFMWTKCQLSCVNYAKDVKDECPGWAEEGECSNNPRYIQFNCPESCRFAISWSPWARREVDVEPYITVSDAEEACPIPIDILTAADQMRSRLTNYVRGGAGAVVGLVSTAPSEFLGMYGLTEAVLYTARLYQVAARSKGVSDDEVKTLIVELEQAILACRYEGDSLMRNLPMWIARLKDVGEMFPSTRLDGSCESDPKAVEDSKTALNLLPDLLEVPKVKSAGTKLPANIDATVTLSNGVVMPVLGLGTWQLNGEECEQAVTDAMIAGYRHIDTAQAYANEEEVGRAVKALIDKGALRREDLFIATKLSDSERYNTYDGVIELVNDQLNKLQTTYIDLYMLHSPVQDAHQQTEMWRAMEYLLKQGTFRAIGVSNFDGHELRKLINSASVKPMVLQNKLDVYHLGKQLDNRGDDIVRYSREQGVLLVSYSPFSAYPFVMAPLDDPVVRYLAKQKQVTPAQLLLRWTLQQGFAAIPRSSNAANLASNLATLRLPPLSDEEMRLLNSLQPLVTSPVSKYVAP